MDGGVNTTWAHFGGTLDSAGDINNDTYDDIIVGANANDLGSLNAAYVWFGSEDGLGGGSNGSPANADWKATDTTNSMMFAYGVRGIGDVNGDDYDDVLVCAVNYDGSYTNQGAVFVYYGSADGLGDSGTTLNADWMAISEQNEARFGWGVDGIGDVNGDDIDDLAVGAYAYDNTEASEGKVFVWYGAETTGLGDPGTPTNADWEAESNDAGAIFGYSVNPAGDVNNDGYADLLVTAPQYSTGGAYFVWTGSDSGLGDDGTPQNADQSAVSDQAGSDFGRDNASAMDVDGDGGDDIFVAARLYTNGETTEGMVFGYYANLGELKITKLFDPMSSGYTGTFAINYDCDDGTEHDGTVNLLAGESQTITSIPVGTQCTSHGASGTDPTHWLVIWLTNL